MNCWSRLMEGTQWQSPTVALIVLAVIQVSVADAYGQQAPTLTIVPTAGPPSTSITVSGTGFPAGETWHIEQVGPSGETGQLGTAIVGQDGRFTAMVRVPVGDDPSNLIGLQVPLIAVPASSEPSFGNISAILANPPRAAFTFTPASPIQLPATGTGPPADSRPLSTTSVAGVLGLICALSAWSWWRVKTHRRSGGTLRA